MSDTETKTPAADAPKADAPAAAAPRERKAKSIYATLTRGANYSVRHEGRVYRFKGGVKVGPIPASLKTYLEESAVDHLTITDGENISSTEPRSKFEFSEA